LVCLDKNKSWYPPFYYIEKSGRNEGRWTETLESQFSVADDGNRKDSAKPSTRSDGLTRVPLENKQWKNHARNASDIFDSQRYLNTKALEVIDEWGGQIS
jgi:hypothetical protein